MIVAPFLASMWKAVVFFLYWVLKLKCWLYTSAVFARWYFMHLQHLVWTYLIWAYAHDHTCQSVKAHRHTLLQCSSDECQLVPAVSHRPLWSDIHVYIMGLKSVTSNVFDSTTVLRQLCWLPVPQHIEFKLVVLAMTDHLPSTWQVSASLLV